MSHKISLTSTSSSRKERDRQVVTQMMVTRLMIKAMESKSEMF